MVSRMKFSTVDLDQITTRIVGTYTGPEGKARLDALYDRSTNTTLMLGLRGKAPEEFLNRAVEYFNVNRIPLPERQSF